MTPGSSKNRKMDPRVREKCAQGYEKEPKGSSKSEPVNLRKHNLWNRKGSKEL